MISLRKRDEAVARVLTITSIALLAVALLVMLVVPKPQPTGLRSTYDRAALASRVATKKAQDRLAQLTAQVAAQTWPGPAEQVGPAALAQVTALARARGLRLVAFRPQRAIEGDFVQLPYIVNVEGSFPAVMALQKDLEAGATRLAVNLVQISSADASSDRVTGTIGLVAYLRPAGEEVARGASR